MVLAGAGMLFIPGMPVTGFQGTAANELVHCTNELVHCNLVRQCDDNRLGFDIERARRNYIALARGARSPSQLSAVEAQEVRELLKLMEQNRSSNKRGYERCREQQLGGRADPTELELRLIDLKCSVR